MKNMFLFFGLLIALPLRAEIIETKEMAHILRYTDSRTLILFNISDTLYEPATTLADNKWRVYFAGLAAKTIPNPDAFVNRIKYLIVKNIPKKVVERCTIHLIRELQKEQIPVLGITRKASSTSYAENFGEITNKHLKGLGIDLEVTLNFLRVLDKQDENAYSFDFGIIFTNKQPEGPAVISFLKRIPWITKKVVMVDNSREALENVEEALKATEIKFIGLRYGRCDGRKLSFDPDLGTIQFLEYVKKGRVMYDEEAKKYKAEHPDISFEALMVDYIRANAGQ